MTLLPDLAVGARLAAPLRVHAVEACRQAILQGIFSPGQRLVEKDLCKMLSVSRTVVRETLRHLEAEGLITVIANRGPVVATLTEEEASNLFEFREVLEGFAGKYCAMRATTDQKRALRRALNEVKEAMKSGNLTNVLQVKDKFYLALIEGAQNAFLRQALRSLHARAQVFRSLSLSAPGRFENSYQELEAIVSAIEAGEPEKAQEFCEAHVRSASRVAGSRLGSIVSETGRSDD